MKEIRRVVDFDFKDANTHRKKILITRYYRQITALKQRGFTKFYTPRTKKARAAVGEATGTKTSPHFKRLLIDRYIDNIRVRGRNVTIRRNGLAERYKPLNRKEMASDTERYLTRLTRSLGGDRFRITAGKYILPGTHNRAGVIQEVQRLMDKYGNWQEWLNIVAVEYDEEDETD